jgi:hypothetical protein
MKLEWRVILGLSAILLLPLIGQAADDGAIQGRVVDSSGAPVVGALVTVTNVGPLLQERSAFSGRNGWFLVPNMGRGDYSVRVMMQRYLPAVKDGIHLTPGATATLTVTLKTPADVALRAAARDAAKESQDIVWVLRSSRSTQPVLRVMESGRDSINGAAPTSSGDYTGYFQVYSKSIETGAGSTDSFGSHFSVTMPLQNAKVTLAGQYNELPIEPRGVSASYEFKPADRRHTQFGVNARAGTSMADGASLRELRLDYKEKLESFDHIVLEYGAQAGRADQVTTHTYLRPSFGISYIPDARTVIGFSASSQAPSQGDDPIRGKNYFEQVYVPPALEKYRHAEVGASRFIADETKLSVAAFDDRIDNQALLVSAPGSRSGLLIYDGRNMPSQGVRVHLNRNFRGVDAGLGYTVVSGIGIASEATSFDDVRNKLTRRNFHVVTARIKTDVDATKTELTAVYRWTSDFMAAPLDPYQPHLEYNDPTLSITVAQNLPTFRPFPGRIQAILDARNLLEPTFGPRRVDLTPAPRFMKGGINIKF